MDAHWRVMLFFGSGDQVEFTMRGWKMLSRKRKRGRYFRLTLRSRSPTAPGWIQSPGHRATCRGVSALSIARERIARWRVALALLLNQLYHAGHALINQLRIDLYSGVGSWRSPTVNARTATARRGPTPPPARQRPPGPPP